MLFRCDKNVITPVKFYEHKRTLKSLILEEKWETRRKNKPLLKLAFTASQSAGRRFDPDTLHQMKSRGYGIFAVAPFCLQ